MHLRKKWCWFDNNRLCIEIFGRFRQQVKFAAAPLFPKAGSNYNTYYFLIAQFDAINNS